MITFRSHHTNTSTLCMYECMYVCMHANFLTVIHSSSFADCFRQNSSFLRREVLLKLKRYRMQSVVRVVVYSSVQNYFLTGFLSILVISTSLGIVGISNVTNSLASLQLTTTPWSSGFLARHFFPLLVDSVLPWATQSNAPDSVHLPEKMH